MDVSNSSQQDDVVSRNVVRRQRRRRNDRLIVAGVLFVLAVGLVIAGRDLFQGEQSTELGAQSKEQGARSEDSTPLAPRPVLPVPRVEPLVDDDGSTLWDSPTSGPPLDLSYLPPGPQIILALRPAALLADAEGDKVFFALGPLGTRGVRLVEQRTGLSLEAIDRLIVGWRTTLDGGWDATLVVTPKPTIATEELKQAFTGTTHEHAGQSYVVANELAYYRPADRNDQLLVVAAPAAMREILDLAGRAPPLRRELERLLDHSDAARHVTLLCAPNFLFSDGRGMFTGPLSRLRGPLFWFLGDGANAAALSLHWDENCFVEFLAVPTLDLSADRLADELAQRVGELPERVEEYVLELSPQPYGRRLVARFPGMVRKLAAYTRHGFERDHAVLRCYLPAIAGHNLLMGAELTLAEPTGGSAPAVRPTAEAVSPGPIETRSVRERLQRRTSLRFSRDTLETALGMLADDLGVEIVIRGSDLQLEGITKNQSFGIDLADQPAEQILVEILRLANPDKTATGPADPRQKLVYVIAPAGPNGAEVVFVTTRARAAERGDELPLVFVDGPPR